MVRKIIIITGLIGTLIGTLALSPAFAKDRLKGSVYAEVERVIDGDSMLARIDLGFQVWKEQRIRFADVDTPDIDKKGGQEAFEFVREEMTQAPFVVLKTNKVDIYGRYVAHVFYSPTKRQVENVFLNGRYLNQELLDRKLAKRV